MTFMLAMIMTSTVWAVYSELTAEDPVRAIEITACTLETYTDLPERIEGTQRWEPGPRQIDCEKPLSARNDSITTNDAVRVIGQVCNNADFEVKYNISVWWEPVDRANGDTEILPVIGPRLVTYQPGCDEPYLLPFDFPLRSAFETLPLGTDIGSWGLAGHAESLNPERYRDYSWAPTGSARVVVGGA